MHEITGSTAVNNHFVDGTSTQSGTVVNSDWLNTVQDEICNLITSVGIPLNSDGNDDKKQLIAAITKLIVNSVTNFVTQTDFGNLITKVNTLVTQTDFANLVTKVSTLVSQSDFTALQARVQWCEGEINKIEKKESFV